MKQLKQVGTGAKHLAIDCFVPARSRPFNKLFSGQATPTPPRGTDVPHTRQTGSETGRQGPNGPSLVNTVPAAGREGIAEGPTRQSLGQIHPLPTGTAPPGSVSIPARSEILQDQAGADAARPKSRSTAQKVGRKIKHIAAEWFVPARSYPFNKTRSPSREAPPQRPATPEPTFRRNPNRESGPLPPPVRHVYTSGQQVDQLSEPSLSRSSSIESFSDRSSVLGDPIWSMQPTPLTAFETAPYDSDDGATFFPSPQNSPAHDGVASQSPRALTIVGEIEPATAVQHIPASDQVEGVVTEVLVASSAEGESPAGNGESLNAVGANRLTRQPSDPEIPVESQVVQRPERSLSRSSSIESPSEPTSIPVNTMEPRLPIVTIGHTVPVPEPEEVQSDSDEDVAFFTPPLQDSPAHDTVASETPAGGNNEPPTPVQNRREEGPFVELSLQEVQRPDQTVIEIVEEETHNLHSEAEASAFGAGGGFPPSTPGGSFHSEDVRQPPDANAGLDIAEIRAGKNPLRSPRRDKTNRQDYVTAFTNHTRAGAATTLHRFAKVSTELTATDGKPPLAPTHTPGIFSRAFNAVKRSVGLPGNVDWMKSTIRNVRADACRSHPGKPSATPTQALWLLGQAQPVSLFWKQPELAKHANFGQHRDEVLGHLDTLGQRSSPRVSLALSFACLSATEGSPSKQAGLNMELFQTLADPQLINRLLAPPGTEPAGTAPTLDLARSVLHQCTRSNRFDALVKALSPSLQDHQLPILKRYLQADDAVRNTPARVASDQVHDEDLAAMEEGRGSNTPTLAMRVRDSARAQLAAADNPVPLTPRQAADEFFWNNNFHEEGPGTPLHELKQHFFEAIEQLSKNAQTKGPLNSAYEYGLAGADRKLFSDEEEKLNKLRDDPELDGLVQDMQGSLVKLLNAENASLAGPNATPSDNAIRILACLIALEAWSPEHRGQLSLTDIVQGRAHEVGDTDSEARLVASACARFIAKQRFDRADDMKVAAPALTQQFNLSQMIRSGALMTKVRNELKNVRLGFPALGELARECGVEVSPAAQDVLERARQTINTETEYPKERTPEAAGEMMQKFLGEVYFGNHIKLSNVESGGFSGRGAAVNLSTYLADPPHAAGPSTAPGSSPLGAPSLAPSPAATPASILAKVPVLARGDLRVEGSREHVIRAGAATHGGEFFLGTDVKRRLAAGGGFHTGYVVPLGDGGSQGRISGGLDTLPYSYDRSDYEGVMLRVDRVVREDVADLHEPRFVQNEAEVRETMSGLARTLFKRAKDAPDEVSREQILEDIISEFGSHGLSITLMKQQSSAHRSEASLGMGVSATTGAWAGGRFGLGGGGAIEKGWSTNVSEMDTTGSYRINNLRTGWFERKKVSADLGGNVYTGSGGIPPTTLAGATWSMGEAGGSVRVRTPLREGNIVPEKTFSDTETPDKNLFKEYVLSNRQKWDDLFAYQFRHLPPEEALSKGQDRTDAFLYKMENLREENHVYYARERLHPEVAERINDWAGVEALVPPAMESFRAELAGVQQRLASDDRSWGAASLIAYQKNVQQDGLAGSLGGFKGANVAAVEGEREIIFDTIGWPNLRQRERDNAPQHLDQ